MKIPEFAQDDALPQSAVIGAAGKMGRGIALLLLQDLIPRQAADATIRPNQPRVVLIDSDERPIRLSPSRMASWG